MADRVQFISREKLVKRTLINGVVDEDKFAENIQFAQDIKLRNLIGSTLLDKLKADVIASTLTGNYLALVQNQITDYLVYSVAADYIQLSPYSIDNGGASKYIPENGTDIIQTEADRISTITENKAEAYGKILIDYLGDNKALFPEYKSTGITSYNNGWQLDDEGTC